MADIVAAIVSWFLLARQAGRHASCFLHDDAPCLCVRVFRSNNKMPCLCACVCVLFSSAAQQDAWHRERAEVRRLTAFMEQVRGGEAAWVI